MKLAILFIIFCYFLTTINAFEQVSNIALERHKRSPEDGTTIEDITEETRDSSTEQSKLGTTVYDSTTAQDDIIQGKETVERLKDPQRIQEINDRPKRQFGQPPLNEEEDELLKSDPNCIFGEGESLTFCQWSNMNTSSEMWIASKGANSGWLGGPAKDQTNEKEGGYVLYETSKLGGNQLPNGMPFYTALFMSPLLSATTSLGNCIGFWYAMKGLSQERLRILLRRPPVIPIAISGAKVNFTDEQLLRNFIVSDGRDDIVLWEHHDSTNGEWINGQATYTFNDKHVLIFEGIPLRPEDPQRAYRGYIALDGLSVVTGDQCEPFCTFENEFCSWISQADADYFSWSQGTGSDDLTTGPPMDRFSFSYGTEGGGYAYIDSGYPRKPEDKARLVSEEFGPPDPDMPFCMRFWTHMYGNGIGALRVIIKLVESGEEEIIWGLESEQENKWYQAQVTISPRNQFQIIFEGEVGQNNLGDLAIDEITLKEESCPTSPQTSSKIKGHCAFEVDECEWTNFQDLTNRRGDVSWQRGMASRLRAPPMDHTTKTPEGNYVALSRSNFQRLERAWFRSPLITGDGETLCMSFWYFMFDHPVRQTGPALGTLRILTLEKDSSTRGAVPLWMLKNHQGPTWKYGQINIPTEKDKDFSVIFEGSWGDVEGNGVIAIDDITFFSSDCSVKPPEAHSSIIDCHFSKDFCRLMNGSTTRVSWVPASISRRPSQLNDHTFGASVGYAYFEVFRNANNEVPEASLMSEVIEKSNDNEPACLSFWFAVTLGESKLKVTREVADATHNDPNEQAPDPPTVLWQVTNELVKFPVEWQQGQVSIATDTDYKISIVAEATKGGYALDDLKLSPGFCKIKPSTAGNFEN